MRRHSVPDQAGAGLDGLGERRFSGSDTPVFVDPGWIVRFRKPRMTVGLLIVAVALSAVLIEVGVVGWRFVTYRRRAGAHLEYLKPQFSFYDLQARRDWHERMRDKYTKAASRPWESVERDTTEPK
jgi:hypothetical protein